MAPGSARPPFDTTTGHAFREGWSGEGEAPDVSGQQMAAEAPQAAARIIRLEHGLHAIRIAPPGGPTGTIAGMTVPAIQVSSVPSAELDPAEIVASSGESGSWLGNEGGTVVVRAPPGGAQVLITVYAAEQVGLPLEIDIVRIDQPQRAAAIARTATPEREIRCEIGAHIERLGDRRFPGQGWVGNRGDRLRIEAFSIRPIETLAPGDIEYMAFGPGGRETPWASEGKMCGTRGRGLPLTGFAVRLAPHLRGRFETVYEGAFFGGGIAGPCRDGEPCTSAVLDDPLEAMHVRLIERAAG